MSMTEHERIEATEQLREVLAPIIDDQLTKHGVELFLELATTAERAGTLWSGPALRTAALEYQNAAFRQAGKAVPNKIICPTCDSVDCEHAAGPSEIERLAAVADQINKFATDLEQISRAARAGLINRDHHHVVAARLIELGWRRA